jgi:hypothetical protein
MANAGNFLGENVFPMMDSRVLLVTRRRDPAMSLVVGKISFKNSKSVKDGKSDKINDDNGHALLKKAMTMALD